MSDASSPAVTLRRMTAEDIPAVMQLKDAAGWNQLSGDLKRFLLFAPTGCLVAEKAGEVVGSATAVAYGQRFAWIGMVLVDASQRRQGIGKQLLSAAMEAAGDCETIKLDATPAGKQVYDQLGFEDEYELARWVRPAGVTAPAWADTSANVQPLTSDDLPDLKAFDTPVFGANREHILADWLSTLPEVAFSSRDADGALSGYLLGREGSQFRQLGPLVASDEPTARALFSAGVQASGEQSLMVDTLLHTASWTDWLASLGFASTRPLIRMYRGPNSHPGQPSRQWAICGPEWG